MQDFNVVNLEFLESMEKRFKKISCGFNVFKRIRINNYLKSIKTIKSAILANDLQPPCLVDRWFMDDLTSLLFLEERSEKIKK